MNQRDLTDIYPVSLSTCLSLFSPGQSLYEVGGNICESDYDIITYTPAAQVMTDVKGYENLSVSLPVCLSGERRLHPDCVLLDVYRVNPHCDWLIKP